MIHIPLALTIFTGLVAVGVGGYFAWFALIFFGLALLCVVPVMLDRFATAATVAASAFATLVIIELAVDQLWPPDPPVAWDTGDQFRHIEADDVGRVAQPGTYAVQRVSHDGETIYDATYTIGEDGFRLTPGNGHDDASGINLLGCSFAFGQGLDDDETLAYHLGQDLGVATRNFGIIGGGPHEALAILESPRGTQAAVNVLLTSPWHAPRVACARPWSGGAPRFVLDQDGALVRDGFCPEGGATPLVRVLRDSRTFSVMEKAYRVLRRESVSDGQLALYEAVIQRIADISRERGQLLVIGYMRSEALNGVSLDNAAMMQRFEAMGAIVVDVTLAPNPDQLSPDYYLHELDNHPTALANDHRAQLLAPVVEPIVARQSAQDEAVELDPMAK